jgi:hypothetical protein
MHLKYAKDWAMLLLAVQREEGRVNPIEFDEKLRRTAGAIETVSKELEDINRLTGSSEAE